MTDDVNIIYINKDAPNSIEIPSEFLDEPSKVYAEVGNITDGKIELYGVSE